MDSFYLVERQEYFMKLRMLVFTVISFGLTCAALAADNYSDLAAQGYRWITIDGPYAGTSQEGAQRITSHRTDAAELQMVESLQAYYLITGTLVQVVQDDAAKGMSQIRLGGITRDLWTYTKYLSKRPIEDPYGVIENPENSGLIPTATAEMSQLPEHPEATRAVHSSLSELPTISAGPTPSISPASPTESRKSRRETNQQK
jgi:hypothetical protein